jgi:putative membrane protein
VKTLRLALLELLRFREGRPRLVPLALALVPLLSAGVYLWATWDVYGRLDRIPVAVVNQDVPVSARGVVVDAGQIFVQQLQQDRIFDWRFVDLQRAQRGLRSGAYYFAITVPPDFSSRLAGPATTTPQRASMLITLDDANGYLAGKLEQTAQAKLQDQITAAAHTAFAERVLGDLTTLHQRLTQATTAIARQRTATRKVSDDAAKVASGLQKGQTLAGKFTTTNQQLISNAQQVLQSVSGSAAAAADQIPIGAQSALDGASAAQRATGLAASSASSARASADIALNSLSDLGQAHPSLLGAPSFRLAMDAVRMTRQAAGDASSSAEQANAATQQAAAGAQRVQSAASGPQQQLHSAANQASDLIRAAQQSADQADELARRATTASKRAQTLQADAKRLDASQAQLSASLRSAFQQIPPASPEQRARIAATLSSPVDVVTTNVHPARVYGRGLAPLFFGVALWVFALVAFLLLRPLNPRALAGQARALTVAVAGWLPAAAIGVVGALLLYGVLDGVLGLDPLHRLWTIGLVVLAALSFVALVHFLRTAFGAVGDAVTFALLTVQLTASGGLYPLQTGPSPFLTVHQIMPITYVVDGLRVSISGGPDGRLIRAAIVLAAILVVSLALTTVAVARQRTWTMARLKPAVTI